jgi:glycosyltransferase involved in cell wall biosynthesis
MLQSLGRFDLAVAVKPYPDAWLGLGLARLGGATCVMDVDDDDGGYRGGLLGLLTRILQAPGFRVAQRLSTHHPLLHENLAEAFGAPRVLDLAQGVDLSVFHPRPAERPRPVGFETAASLLAFTAHLNIACQLDVLLEVLRPWLGQHPRAVLAVAGGGPAEARFRRLAEPLGAQVRFLGQVDPAGAAALLAAADASLSAYGAGEGNRFRVPMKVAESLAVGTPVVTNLVPGLQALEPYLFSTPLEPAAFGQALDQALAAEDGRTARGQAWVRQHLDWTVVAAQFLLQLRSRVTRLPRGDQEA